MEVFNSTCHCLNNMYFSPGWPGARHSVDICEGLEEWSGGRGDFHQSDAEEEVLVQPVRLNIITPEKVHIKSGLCLSH